MSKHVKIHLEVQPHACDVCSFAARHASQLQRHVEQVHWGLNMVCVHCHVFEAIPNLRGQTLDHCLSCDKVARPDASYAYVCIACDYHTPRRTYMRAHLATHEGEKPFRCDMCTYSARRKSHLDEHVRRHTGEKPYQCGKCGYCCVQGTQLLQHLRRVHKLSEAGGVEG